MVSHCPLSCEQEILEQKFVLLAGQQGSNYWMWVILNGKQFGIFRKMLCTVVTAMFKDRPILRALYVCTPPLISSCKAVARFFIDLEAVTFLHQPDFISNEPVSSNFFYHFSDALKGETACWARFHNKCNMWCAWQGFNFAYLTAYDIVTLFYLKYFAQICFSYYLSIFYCLLWNFILNVYYKQFLNTNF